jgi:two-component system chemotaxis sensor kinase CheA
VSISDDEIRQAIAETFRVESDEHIQAMNRLLLRLEQGGVKDLPALLDEIAREAHTLKGASSILGLTLIQETAHCLEEVFETLRDASREAPPELFDLLYAALDKLALGCQRVEDPTGDDALVLEKLQSACKRYVSEIGVGEFEADQPQGGNAPDAEAPEPQAEALEPVPPAEGLGGGRDPAAAALAMRPPQSAQPASFAAQARTASEMTTRPPPDADGDAKGTHTGEETIRVPIRKLDSLMAQIGELLIAKIRNDDRLQALRELQLELEDTNKDWTKFKELRAIGQPQPGVPSGPGRPVATKYREILERLETHLKTLTHRVASVGADFSRDAMHMSILTENLQEDIKKARMLPVSTILDGFHRLVRDVARREGKQATLTLAGTETEVDKRVLELIKDPLMHLLRNAVSHGIEEPAERARLGKHQVGSVTVRTQQGGGNIVVEVEDDGAGIEIERVVEKAVERGLVDEMHARALGEREALLFIFHPGFSTKDSVTDISGRGVGMDVVRRNVQRVQGQLHVETVLGRGTRFVITLPLTLSTTKSLLVEVSGQTFALPIQAVERIVRIHPDEIEEIEGEPVLVTGGAPVGVVYLADVLGLAPVARPEDEPKLPVVLLNVSERRLGLVVDMLVDEQEIVVKPLGRQLAHVRNIAGGAVMGSGAVLLVLNPLEIVRFKGDACARSPRDEARKANGPGRRLRVVVAEDSITTRTLEKSILESAGYEVVTCKDGAEAYEYLAVHACDALVTDIDMPRMDGFALVEAVRALPRHRDLPIVLVTSLGSDDDKRRGMEVGATAYIVKRDFEQARFLETLRALV